MRLQSSGCGKTWNANEANYLDVPTEPEWTSHTVTITSVVTDDWDPCDNVSVWVALVKEPYCVDKQQAQGVTGQALYNACCLSGLPPVPTADHLNVQTGGAGYGGFSANLTVT